MNLINNDYLQSNQNKIVGILACQIYKNKLTARLNMRMLVVFLIVLFRKMTNITSKFPMKPIMMMSVKRIWKH